MHWALSFSQKIFPEPRVCAKHAGPWTSAAVEVTLAQLTAPQHPRHQSRTAQDLLALVRQTDLVMAECVCLCVSASWSPPHPGGLWTASLTTTHCVSDK